MVTKTSSNRLSNFFFRYRDPFFLCLMVFHRLKSKYSSFFFSLCEWGIYDSEEMNEKKNHHIFTDKKQIFMNNWLLPAFITEWKKKLIFYRKCYKIFTLLLPLNYNKGKKRSLMSIKTILLQSKENSSRFSSIVKISTFSWVYLKKKRRNRY